MPRTVWVVGGFVWVSSSFFCVVVGAVGHALLATPSNGPGRPATAQQVGGQPERPAPQGEPAKPAWTVWPVAAPATTADKSFPYPECGKILEGLRRASGDPKSVEVIEWGEPNPKPYAIGNEKAMRYRMITIRGRNGLGAMQVQRLNLFVTASGECSLTASDWHKVDPIDPTNFYAK